MYGCKNYGKVIKEKSGKNVGKHYGKIKFLIFMELCTIVRKVILYRVCLNYNCFDLLVWNISSTLFLFTKKYEII